MEAPKIKAILYSTKTYKDGSHPIMIRITQNRKRIYKTVGYSVVPDAWDEDNSQVYEKKPQISKRQEGQLNPHQIRSPKNSLHMTLKNHIIGLRVNGYSCLYFCNHELYI